MEFLLLVASDPDAETWDEAGANSDDWVAEMDAIGVRQRGDRLQPAESATTVRVRNGELVVSGGPFTTASQEILGYDIIECMSVTDAIEVASAHPMSRFGCIEIRAVWPLHDDEAD